MARPTLLVVDDEPMNIAVLSRLLNPTYRVLGARTGASALQLVESQAPDLILLDVMMPDLDGYAVLSALQAHPASAGIPVIFVTAMDSEGDEERGLTLGAVDYISKPVQPAVVRARVRTQLELKHARDQLAQQNRRLEGELEQHMREALIAQDLTLCAMAELAETRDNETGNHILRTQSYVEALGRRLQRHPDYAAQLGEADLMRIVKAAPMHDVGKIGIRDDILLKPDKLTPDEFEIMKSHARIGGETLAKAIRKAMTLHETSEDAPLPESVRFLEVARLIALHHHEKWDGTGYPEGLVGVAIPLPARLMALADVFDALTMRRVYKAAWSLDEATRYIVSQSGRHFDPHIVASFVDIQDEFAAISAMLAD